MGCRKNSKRAVHSSAGLHQETRKISSNLNIYLNKIGNQEQIKSKVSRWKEIIKIRAEIMK